MNRVRFKKQGVQKFCQRVFFSVIGSIFCGLGIEFVVVTKLGADSLSTLILGIKDHFDIGFGTLSQLLSLLYLLIAVFFVRKKLGIGSIINALTIGQTIKFITPFLRNQVFIGTAGIIVMFAGFSIMAFGTAIYLQSELGSGPMEAMMFSLSKMTGLNITYSRILLDGYNVTLGIFLGASFGIGSIVAVLCLGPMIKIVNVLLNHLVKFKSEL
ncbi:conserved membrane protein of unknown function [Oenococcus oeni]|uniref:YitT family protein n=1 Tax=Oenococcus oeni TaxID=1247 RepID=A0AAQ2ZGD9_OENOE|nr:membrane protein [Oenococcus oeni]SYW03803.1 conserved membrane hypothetical protein [Oenococcus oeni]VDB98821.1 conserved membrane protein of unknown function [Oenococcus oeni]